MRKRVDLRHGEIRCPRSEAHLVPNRGGYPVRINTDCEHLCMTPRTSQLTTGRGLADKLAPQLRNRPGEALGDKPRGDLGADIAHMRVVEFARHLSARAVALDWGRPGPPAVWFQP